MFHFLYDDLLKEMPNVDFNSATDNVEKKSKDIEKALSKHAVVLIWASWCHHCTAMKPDWDRVKNDMSGKGINFIEIESINIERLGQTNPMIVKRLTHNKLYFPMINVASNDKLKEYTKDRSYTTMKKTFSSLQSKPKSAKHPAKAASSAVKKMPKSPTPQMKNT
jgi:thiol-disulfide isomerase/thioredoxin